ncbi:MAG TPA: PadR family transcriptional regulator, partial [Oscillospiraceae bacterium]|nr:PadR family transcriptional regulator [Oscillospiraceae bacterium]
FEMKEGTLYPILHALEADGCVTARMAAAENGRPRRYYRITGKGKELLRRKAEEWTLFSQRVGNIVLGRA